ncbi:MAG: FecR family protein, partial [bacterium]
AYELIDKGLRAHNVPKVDASALSRRMAEEMGQREESLGISVHLPRLAFVTACVLGLLVGLTKLVPLLQIPEPRPVNSVSFVDKSSSRATEAPFLWKHNLQRGNYVTIPNEIAAELNLSDGSILSCSPETQIAVSMAPDRHIALHSGSIHVQAAQIKGSSMTVETPVGKIEVVGTVFWVEVIR